MSLNPFCDSAVFKQPECIGVSLGTWLSSDVKKRQSTDERGFDPCSNARPTFSLKLEAFLVYGSARTREDASDAGFSMLTGSLDLLESREDEGSSRACSLGRIEDSMAGRSHGLAGPWHY